MHSKRYNRQTELPEIGILGQEKLTNAKVLIIGAGGLGCPVLQNLVAAGVGHIGIMDGDVVEETNLHRQFLYTLADCGKNKATIATDAVFKQNPEIKVIPYSFHFAKKNAFEIISDYQIIVDCTDDIATRYLINDVSLAKKIPVVYTSIHKFEGQLSVFNYKSGPTYRCLFPENEKENMSPNCSNTGVLGVLPNTLGVLQANEVLKIILEIGEILSGKLLIYNSLNSKFENINFKKNPTEIEKGLQNGFKILNTLTINEVKIVNSTNLFEEITHQNSLVIDIRETYEKPRLDLQKINNVPLSQLDDFLKNTDRNQKIILFCQNGTRSKLTGDYLIKKGFTNLFHLQNGIDALKKNIT
ncbi:HesA/MoeB/ThiF family protein [uncultured Flavobacterium sp.]|uniref:HesA/MoeB/ThiF family protein n=1 Tax=uncultured Flavobacterium sp. TaxID=165435 RepID=UPI0030CA143B